MVSQTLTPLTMVPFPTGSCPNHSFPKQPLLSGSGLCGDATVLLLTLPPGPGCSASQASTRWGVPSGPQSRAAGETAPRACLPGTPGPPGPASPRPCSPRLGKAQSGRPADTRGRRHSTREPGRAQRALTTDATEEVRQAGRITTLVSREKLMPKTRVTKSDQGPDGILRLQTRKAQDRNWVATVGSEVAHPRRTLLQALPETPCGGASAASRTGQRRAEQLTVPVGVPRHGALCRTATPTALSGHDPTKPTLLPPTTNSHPPTKKLPLTGKSVFVLIAIKPGKDHFLYGNCRLKISTGFYSTVRNYWPEELNTRGCWSQGAWVAESVRHRPSAWPCVQPLLLPAQRGVGLSLLLAQLTRSLAQINQSKNLSRKQRERDAWGPRVARSLSTGLSVSARDLGG